MTGMDNTIEQAAKVIADDAWQRSQQWGIAPGKRSDAADAWAECAARALAAAGILATVPLREEPPSGWRCPGCGSDQWIRASLTRGLTVITQCVPCGRYVNTPPPDRAEGDGRAEQ